MLGRSATTNEHTPHWRYNVVFLLCCAVVFLVPFLPVIICAKKVHVYGENQHRKQWESNKQKTLVTMTQFESGCVSMSPVLLSYTTRERDRER